MAANAVPASPPRENLVRALYDEQAINLRAEGDEMPVMTGHFSVFNQWTEIRSAVEGHFLERIAPGAFKKTFSERTPKVLFQHGKDPQIGDKVLGPIASLREDDYGAAYEVPLLDTSYNRDLLPGLKAGLYGASFRFSVLQEDVVQRPARSDYNPNGLTERTVKEALVPEFGPVTFGAYANATSGIRSLTDDFVASSLIEDEDMLERLAALLAEKTRQQPQPFTISFSGLDGLYATTSNTTNVAVIEATPDEAEDRAEPEASEPTTPTEPDIAEPEPSEATTRSDEDDKKPFKFLFVEHRSI